jgi:hypothetical protein
MIMPVAQVAVDSVVQRDPEVIAAEVDNDLVMVSISSGFYYGVSDVARDIWEKIEKPAKVSNIIDGLVECYEIDRQSCEEQTLAFLDDLMKDKLVRIVTD